MALTAALTLSRHCLVLVTSRSLSPTKPLYKHAPIATPHKRTSILHPAALNVFRRLYFFTFHTNTMTDSRQPTGELAG
jgi:hypothetical protein